MTDVIIPTLDQVLARVDAFLERHPTIKETRLARDATGESSLIADMRAGRSPRLRTLNRLDDFMRAKDEEAEAEAARPFSSASLPDLPDTDLGPPRRGRLLQSLVDAAGMQ